MISALLPAPSRARRAFTLIELLTVIAIIGILAAILIPVVGKVRATAKTTKNVSNLRALSGAFFVYAQDNKNYLPRARDNDAVFKINGAWPAHLRDYIQDMSILVRPGAEEGDGLVNGTNAIGGAGATLDKSGDPISWSYVINGGGGTTALFPFIPNGTLPGSSSAYTRVQLSNITRPSQTMMLADAAGYEWWVNVPTLAQMVTKIRFDAADRKTTMLFFDGHVSRPSENDLTLETFKYKN